MIKKKKRPEVRFNGKVKRLFFSNFFQLIASALITVFVSAFIWRFTESFWAVALYPLGQYLVQPFIFWVNGLALRRIKVSSLYLLGATLSGFSIAVVVLFSQEMHVWIFFLLGFLRAIGEALYWPNRNYLEFQEIKDGARNYYFSLISAVGWIMSILAPPLAGGLIVWGPFSGWYTAEEGYWIIFALVLGLMTVAGIIVAMGKYQSYIPQRITRFSKRKFWNERRLLNLAHGIVNGVWFIAPLVVLMFLGNEGVLGVTTAGASLLAAGVLYWYGCSSSKDGRYRFSLYSSLIFMGCALALVLLPHPWNAIIYVLLAGVASNFFYVAVEPILLAHSDREMRGQVKLRYSFIFDNEFFLCFGRVIGILLLLGLALLLSERLALLWGSLLVGAIQLGLLGLVLKKRRRS